MTKQTMRKLRLWQNNTKQEARSIHDITHIEHNHWHPGEKPGPLHRLGQGWKPTLWQCTNSRRQPASTVPPNKCCSTHPPGKYFPDPPRKCEKKHTCVEITWKNNIQKVPSRSKKQNPLGVNASLSFQKCTNYTQIQQNYLQMKIKAGSFWMRFSWGMHCIIKLQCQFRFTCSVNNWERLETIHFRKAIEGWGSTNAKSVEHKKKGKA